MKVYVAKQPIYDIYEDIVGYELLYRQDSTNVFPDIDRDQATAEVIINTHLNIGLHRLTEGKQYCIQFTERLLEEKLPTFFNSAEMVVKISKDVILSKRLVDIVCELKDLGYDIILNEALIDLDFPFLGDLLTSIKYLILDFSNEITRRHQEMEGLAAKYGFQLVAEKIEKPHLYEQAKRRGYSLFQGYFFSKPVIESTYEIPSVFRTDPILTQFPQDILNEDTLVEIIEKDLSFSIQLLRLINSNSIQNGKVCSIQDAISLIGLEEVQKWVQLLMFRYSLNSPTRLSEEMNRLTLTRAKLCEYIGKLIGSPYPSCFYLMGLISMIEKINQESMEEVLEGLPIKDELYEAIMGKENEYRNVLDLVQAVEQADWKIMNKQCKKLNITERDLFRLYAESLNWTNDSFQGEKKQETVILH
ncbi:EAL and HDOD domain-containing protein [Niallia sp. Krafla_26]|uniref:EAL and HDOD domain-containing protein n=1 Tax=Niallia sp. Krafla_26 TaxID=3064703 RepID=UPI003D168A04